MVGERREGAVEVLEGGVFNGGDEAEDLGAGSNGFGEWYK